MRLKIIAEIAERKEQLEAERRLEAETRERRLVAEKKRIKDRCRNTGKNVRSKNKRKNS